jgi:DNA anti-recombination protein RmuC
MKKGEINDAVVRILARMEEKEEQLIIQAKEYERRLEALNGEAGRLREMQQTYLQKETYETNIQTQNEKNDRAVGQVTERLERSVTVINDRRETLVAQYNDRLSSMEKDLRKDLKELMDWKTAEFGKDKGKDSLTKYLPWMVTSIIAIIALILMYLMYKK